MDAEKENSTWLDRPLTSYIPKLNIETLLIIFILIVTVFSRFYILGDRVMSHDEVNHVVPSYDLFQGLGYRHDPVTHGPLQFHLVALTYFLFGDNDFTSRVPAALFSVATVIAALFCFRRYLGRIGSLVAGFLFMISPYMLFYGRYTRNEAFIGLFGLLMLYAMLRYLHLGQNRDLYLLTAVLVLHFTSKETAFIYTAQALLFLAFLFLEQVTRREWVKPEKMRPFIFAVLIAFLLLAAALGLAGLGRGAEMAASPDATAATAAAQTAAVAGNLMLAEAGLVIVAILALVAAIYLLIQGMTWKEIRRERSFDLIVLIGTLVLPQLVAFPVKILGFDPLDYSTQGIIRTALVLVPLVLIAIAIGIWWNRRVWLISAAIFYGIFTVFYTTFFTNGQGFMTGLVGSLGYWLSQQGVQRGSQPWYYFALIQIPMYEFLPAIGTLFAGWLGLRSLLHRERVWHAAGTLVAQEEVQVDVLESDKQTAEAAGDEVVTVEENEPVKVVERPAPTLALLLFWSFTSLVAYSVAGEKMPWLTVHITMGMILAAGWSFGYLIETTDWKEAWKKKGLIVLLLIPVFLASVFGLLSSIFGVTPPFQGKELVQLQATATFVFALAGAIASGWGLSVLLTGWSMAQTRRFFSLVFVAFLALLTARAAFRASFINYDNAKEYLVYAHAARGPKDILAQVEEISHRTVGGDDIAVAYDNDSLYPYWWYFRDYPNKRWFSDAPTRDLKDNPIILVGDANLSKVLPIVGQSFYRFDYVRLWWPNQDYFNLTWDRIWNAVKDPELRASIFNIWFNRDYTEYAQATKNDAMTLTTWEPSNRIHMFIRKDIVAQIWNYGVVPAPVDTTVTDPYQAKTVQLNPDLVVGAAGTDPGQFQSPRSMAFAPDGSFYVADSHNNRIQHLDANGQVINIWGNYADVANGDAPGGTFNEPWGVAVGPDGSVYVSDTWNNRIQKFSADGSFIKMWGVFGQAETPDAFWGPRGLAVDTKGRLYVLDTGNKRVVVFDADGNSVTEFGGAGMDAGQFDEPVGIAIDQQGLIYITDTWNQRIQVFSEGADGVTFAPLRSWDVTAWYGESLDNKPFIAVDAQGNVYVTDPEAYRVLEFTSQGEIVRVWGDYSTGPDGFGLTSGIAVDSNGEVWVSDSVNNRLLRFKMPTE